ncbi:hypothetical protein N0V83_002535 [Neocucurbitaria cava]|uniref:Amidohydrolase-related domain-containing protein n=1 Tax=Neocucurbitaria cava TaxID=798079 RepID=A0A9W8YC93_9PLEO|nr:hypothetical protein N0V83_002535 [Neocucurbitaria cava]
MAPTTSTTHDQDLLTRINTAASAHSIDLSILPFHQEALESITSLFTTAHTTPTYDFSTATRIDTHTHPIPPWFRALEPQAAGRATPSWNPSAHLQFMSSHSITHSILCISTPQANAFSTDPTLSSDAKLRKKKTIALARLLNEFSAELCRVYPKRFSWLAVTPLPYVEEGVVEARYALEELGAVGRLYARVWFPHLHWRASHGAGAFPDISERFLLGFPDVSDEARKAYKERFWYDSAGPVYPNQVKGLTEGMGIPVSQLVFGTDYPYGIGFWDVDANIAGLSEADFLSSSEKEQIFSENVKGLWAGKLLGV